MSPRVFDVRSLPPCSSSHVRLDDRQRIANFGEQPIETNEYHSVDGAEGEFLWSSSPQNVDLLPQCPNLCLKHYKKLLATAKQMATDKVVIRGVTVTDELYDSDRWRGGGQGTAQSRNPTSIG
jgi:hypothetical protein